MQRNTTNKEFTDLSGLTTCDYSLIFNSPIKVFIECGLWPQEGQKGTRLTVLVGTKLCHHKRNPERFQRNQGKAVEGITTV